MTDLLSYADGGPGHRGVDTSIAGAEHINKALPKLQASVLSVISSAGVAGATGDEIATALDWERFRVRPRTSELRTAGRIVDSGKRRQSIAGIASIVWVTPAHEPLPDSTEAGSNGKA